MFSKLVLFLEWWFFQLLLVKMSWFIYLKLCGVNIFNRIRKKQEDSDIHAKVYF